MLAAFSLVSGPDSPCLRVAMDASSNNTHRDAVVVGLQSSADDNDHRLEVELRQFEASDHVRAILLDWGQRIRYGGAPQIAMSRSKTEK